ncbi:hypothetical protein [Streptomyces sp. MBT33]|uniref:hypothetical protein n=1 Tax=Streptomyces sp. MBT33 TaxID=1488363 RepID=UPI001F2A76A6|nr:hypothetical protein [Streptomyces sp. MBT33]
MPRHSGGHRAPQPLRSGRDPRRIRLLALTGVVVAAVVLPLAVASAGPSGDKGSAVVRAPARRPVHSSPPTGDAKAPSARPTGSPLLLGLGLATAARCGPSLTSSDGIEAQTCVLTQGEDTWARTYYRNTTGDALDAVLSLMGPGGRTVQTNCAVGAEDEPGMCETPRERTRGTPDDYSAVAEFAAKRASGPLLLRSGSNSGSAVDS